MRRTIIFLFVATLYSIMCSAQIQPFSDCDEDPVFLSSKNGNVYDLNDYVCRNFNYPKDQIAIGRFLRSINIKILIDADGTVKSLECLSNRATESSKKELWRVLSKTIWRPGYKDGHPVASWYYKISLKLISEDLEIPQNFEGPFKRIKKYIGKEPNRFTEGISKSALKNILERFDKFYSDFPLNSEINIPYAKMLASDGQTSKLRDVLKLSASEYLRSISVEEKDFKKYKEYGLPQNILDSITTVSFNGKSIILIRLLAAVYNDIEKNDKYAKEYYEATKDFAKRYIGGSLGHSIVKEDEAYKYRHARRLSIDAAKEAERNTTDLYYKDKIAHEWSYNKVNEIAGKMTNQGLLNSNSYMHDLELRSLLWTEKNLSNNDFNLLAIRSLVTRLSEGEDMEKAQLISMIMDEKVSDKVRKQLQGLYDQVEALRLSHDEIVNNVIMYAPVQDPAKTKEENKAAATEFYRIRDAINNVYHLDWLEKK